ncbi:MAG: thermonuclease family protein [Desulfobacter sp.]|nr:MAG: thermonuclease family protein [Desulfobacter sp.]
MKKLASIVFAVTVFLNVSIAFAGQYSVLRVIDGDTIQILLNGKKEKIRMLNVDTPESVHPDQSRNTEMGRKASKYTKSRLEKRYVDLEFEGKKRGKYGRLLAYVILDGHNYNLELVQKGWSPYYTKYGESQKYHSEFLAAEKQAQKKRLNIWSKKKNNKPVTARHNYHGNVKSHSFHGPSCRHYNCRNCTRTFTSREDAINAGYKPCGICRP